MIINAKNTVLGVNTLKKSKKINIQAVNEVRIQESFIFLHPLSCTQTLSSLLNLIIIPSSREFTFCKNLH